jgi:uncharacterized protein (TIGR02302 family)
MSFLVSIDSRLGLNSRIERRIALARLAILWEQAWPNLWPASGIAGAFLALALLNLFAHLPVALHALLLIAAFAGAGYFLYQNFAQFRVPGWNESARRLERDSALPHRPITERDDRLAAGAGDALAEGLWRAHMRALLARQNRLKWIVPHASLAERDPHHLRYAVLLLLAIGVIVGGSDARTRLAAAFSLGQAAPLATLDAWADPPPYTGEAPIYLPRGIASKPIAVPVGSTIALRVHGRSPPQLTLAPRPPHAPAFAGQGEDYSANGKIARDETIGVTAGGQTLGQWLIKAIPDEAPSIAFAQPPSRTERDAVKLAFTAGDDYGVASARALIRPISSGACPPSASRAKCSLSTSPVNRGGSRTITVDLPLSSTGKTVSETVYRDLTADPYAGLPVEIRLEAKDGAGNIGRSKPVRFVLPARVFTNPLARALVEQRQKLSLQGSAGRDTATLALDALTLAPDAFYQNQSGVYVAIRAAYWALKTARSPQDIAHVQDLLWQTALALERGGLSSAADELRRLQQMISQALAQGAPQPIIDALLQRYQEALNRYLRMLAQNPPPVDAPVPKGAKVLRPQDLQALLNAIQQLSQTGARAQAQQLLAMLQSLLENLHMTAGAGGGQGDKALSDTIKGLGDLMGKQRQLLDKTFREQQGNPDPQAGGPKGLAQQQGNLRDQLNRLMQGLGPKAGGGAKDLGEAGKQMGEAQSNLGDRALDNAGQAERNALDSLRKGAGALAKELMKQNGAEGENGNEDPLGRENGGNGASFGDDTRLPDKSQMARARNILKELRRRAEERGRPKEELDYIDRLLKQF